MSSAEVRLADAAASTLPATSTGAAPAAPLTLLSGDPAAMVCEGDVCFVPAAGSGEATTPDR